MKQKFRSFLAREASNDLNFLGDGGGGGYVHVVGQRLRQEP